MSVAPSNSQGIRPINIGNLTPAPPTTAEIVYVDIYTDPKTKQECILWEDVQLAFYNALHVRHKARIVPFVKDSNLETLKPSRIAAIPGEVLDIVVGNLQNATPQQQQPSVLRQIEQQAARFPKYNPFSTMRPMSSNHLSASVQNARFAPSRNNSPPTVNNSRQQLDESALQARNTELAQQYAKDAMSKIAAKMDLDALYAKGDDGPPGDFWKALECYLKAVRQSHAHAQVSVGDLFSEGQRVSKDTSVAMRWYLKATLQGDTNAQRKAETLTLPQLRQRVAPKAPAKSRPKDQESGRSSRGLQPPSTNNEPRISNDPVPPATESSGQMFLNANFGYKDAQVILGDMYKEGKGVLQDSEQAMLWYLKAANQGSALAQFNVGYIYDHGHGVPQDYEKAMTWYRKAADQGHAISQCSIGFLFNLGQGVPQDYEQAMFWFLKAANQGDALAQYNIGTLYDHGQGVPQDYEKAMFWYLKAANQGDASAQFNIGALYNLGHGVPQDYEQAMTWYRKAADQGHAKSQCNIGTHYSLGQGIPQDYEQAMDWFLKAANQGDALAQFNVGSLYDDGQGVPQDYEQAIFWYLKAANQGYARAQFNIGTLYVHGHGVPQDYEQAMTWYRMAADQGHIESQYNIGVFYLQGHGVPQNCASAAKWLQKAADSGLAPTNSLLEGLNKVSQIVD
ncbi:hypothetical protein BGZ88_004431 [Linnemannia elongata]|nr:hypothetical protein BGZ88_004431 [Linnemannia elongata]